MTPRQRRKERGAAWRKAIAEGRIVRFNDGLNFNEYRTPEAAAAMVKALQDGGDMSAAIVKGEQS